MKAIVYEEFDTADVLELKEVEKPKPKNDELLVKVQATSVNVPPSSPQQKLNAYSSHI